VAARSRAPKPRRSGGAKPLTLSHVVGLSAAIPPERGGPFRSEKLLLKSHWRNDPQTLGLKDAIVDELAGRAARGERFKPGRKPGAAVRHIGKLALEYRDLPAKELRRKADEEILAGMDDRTFANHVSAARSRAKRRR
jgi:hypothetical protein